jgi:hypothetical protein
VSDAKPETEALDRLNAAIGDRDVGVELSAPPDDVFQGLAAVTTTTRMFGCAVLLREGMGTTTVAAATRGTLESAAQMKWRHGPSWETGAARGQLEYERQGLVDLVSKYELFVPNVDRWLHPLHIQAAIDPVGSVRAPDGKRIIDKRSTLASALLGMPSAAADLLAMAGHANATAGLLTVSEGSAALGFEASPVGSALLAHAVGSVGVHAGGLFDDAEIQGLLVDLRKVCTAVTQLPSVAPPGLVALPIQAADTAVPFEYLPTQPIHDELLDNLFAHLSAFRNLLKEGPTPYESPSKIVNLESALPYLTAIDTALVCFAAAEAHIATDLAAVSARMLLEAGARATWTFNDGQKVEGRYALIRNEGTHKRAALRQKLRSQGVPDHVIDALLSPLSKQLAPDHDKVRTLPAGTPDKQPPPIEQLLRLGMGFAEEGWLALAYSLLSQVTHLTPLGVLHATARETPLGPGLSHEMTALAVDVAVLGVITSALPHAHLVAAEAGRDIRDWDRSMRVAAAKIHNAARLLHFLD